MVEGEKRVNIAISGGPGMGKSTLAALLFAELKTAGLDYDLIGEEGRKLKAEFGNYRSPFERFYMWRQQEREESRSRAADGFITDTPLFHFYIKALMYASEPRDELAVRELFRMCLEIHDRYQLIVLPKNPLEIPYKKDNCRQAGQERSLQHYNLSLSFIAHHWLEKLVLVVGNPHERLAQVRCRLEDLHQGRNSVIENSEITKALVSGLAQI